LRSARRKSLPAIGQRASGLHGESLKQAGDGVVVLWDE
jgi:hypothetical protein